MLTATTTLTTASVRRPIGIAKGLLLLSAFYIGIAAYYIGLTTVSHFVGIRVPQGDSLFISLLVAWPPTLLLSLRASGSSLRDCIRPTAVAWPVIFGVVVTILGMVPVLVSVIALIPVPASIREAMEGVTVGNRAMVAVATLVLAPLGEEIFFRGILLSNFLQRYSRSKAIWASAVLFALFHLNPWQAAAALVLGLFFAWIAIETKALWPAILAHMLANFVALNILGKIFFRLGYSEAQIKAMRFYPLPIFIASVVIMAIGFWLLTRALRNRN